MNTLNTWNRFFVVLVFSGDRFEGMGWERVRWVVIETFQVGMGMELVGGVVERYALFGIFLRGTM